MCYAKSLAFSLGKPVSASITWKGISSLRRSSNATQFRPSPGCWYRVDTHCFSMSMHGEAIGCSVRRATMRRVRHSIRWQSCWDFPIPGGRPIEQLARKVIRFAITFHRPMVRRNDLPDDPDYYAFSFSGLKTAVLNAVRASQDRSRQGRHRPRIPGRADRSLVEKTFRAADAFDAHASSSAGESHAIGARRRDERANLVDGATVFAPTPRLATDNAAMIARAGLFRFEQGERAGLDLNAYASLPIPGLVCRLTFSHHDASHFRAVVHHPVSYQIGPFNATGFGLAMLMSFVIGQIVATTELERRGEDAAPVGDMVFAAVIGGLLASENLLRGSDAGHVVAAEPRRDSSSGVD